MGKHLNKFEYAKFNQDKSIVEGQFHVATPHCFHLTSYLFFKSDEEETERILHSIINRFKVYIKYNMNCNKQIIILDVPTRIEQGEKFCITVEFAGLIDKEMTKSLLLDKCERMAMLLEEFTRTLNANMIILTKPSKGNMKKRVDKMIF